MPDRTDSTAWQPLVFDGPLDFPLLLRYFERRAIAGVEQVDLATGVYRRTVRLDRGPGVIQLRRGGDNHLLVSGAPVNEALPAWVADRARAIFALDRDPTMAANHLSADPVLAPLVAAYPGLRVPGTWDPFETGVRTIVGQQVSVAGASTIAARLVERVGTPLESGFVGLTHVFPSPAELADADLRAIGMPGARVAALQGFAEAVAEGRIQLDGTVPLAELIDSICAIKGLGPWTASYIALRIGEPDAFPAADLGLRRALGGKQPLTTRQLEARAEAWRPWRGQAALRLWLGPGA